MVIVVMGKCGEEDVVRFGSKVRVQEEATGTGYREATTSI
jgi:hypothetical protein